MAIVSDKLMDDIKSLLSLIMVCGYDWKCMSEDGAGMLLDASNTEILEEAVESVVVGLVKEGHSIVDTIADEYANNEAMLGFDFDISLKEWEEKLGPLTVSGRRRYEERMSDASKLRNSEALDAGKQGGHPEGPRSVEQTPDDHKRRRHRRRRSDKKRRDRQ